MYSKILLLEQLNFNIKLHIGIARQLISIMQQLLYSFYFECIFSPFRHVNQALSLWLINIIILRTNQSTTLRSEHKQIKWSSWLLSHQFIDKKKLEEVFACGSLSLSLSLSLCVCMLCMCYKVLQSLGLKYYNFIIYLDCSTN